jgi:hypothetical protein
MQESSSGEAQEIIYVPSTKYVFHECPVCLTVTTFPEKSKLPSLFDKIRKLIEKSK